MWNKIFVRDSMWFGILLGLVLPIISYLFLLAMDESIYSGFGSHIVAKQEYLMLLGITVNLFPMRYYFVNLKYDKTGRGVLFINLNSNIELFPNIRK